jgi:hypothetical protein
MPKGYQAFGLYERKNEHKMKLQYRSAEGEKRRPRKSCKIRAANDRIAELLNVEAVEWPDRHSHAKEHHT